ncbi:MAG: AAA family ATPase [Deltaproteobacteria bacterium]|nr:AAA family ATPase [Deltaproteobacteria bacterium]
MRSARQADGASSRHGTVLSLFGAKGGSGATTLAVNLAGAAHAERGRTGARVALVDLDLQTGDVLAQLDLTGRFSLGDAFQELGRLRAEQLPLLLPQHPSGLYVLAQSDHPLHAIQPTAAATVELLALLRRAFDLVVIDGLRDLGATSLAALDQTDRILLVLTPDGPSIKSGRRSLDLLQQLGLGARVKVVLNRWHAAHDRPAQSVAAELGATVDAFVENDFPTVIGAANQGRLLLETAPDAAVTQAIRQLARQVGQRPRRRTSESGLGQLAPVAGDQ